MLFPAIFSFSVGLIVMLLSAHVFLNITQELSVKWNFSPLFVSLVIVALGTNLPELTVTLASLNNSDPGLAMGNIVGSSIANITLILGISVFFGNIRVGTTKTPKNAVILLLLTSLFAVLMLSSVHVPYQVILLLLAVIFAISYEYLLALNGRLHEDKKLLKLIAKINQKRKYKPKLVYLALFLGSLIGLAIGGQVTVTAVEDLSLVFNLSTTVLGLTLTAVATSLPELLLAVIATNKKENKVVLGTLIGSNIFNLSLFPAIILFSTIGFKIKKLITIKEVFFLLLVTVLFYTILKKYQGKVIAKRLGLLLILLFPLFTFFILYF